MGRALSTVARAHRGALILAVTAVSALGFLTSAGSATEPDPYTERFRRAGELEHQGHFEAAAEALEPLLGPYPDDYALELQLGWLRFRADQPKRAEHHYRRAVELSGGAQNARLGLAWSFVEQGEDRDAKPIFEALLAESPGLVAARDGLALIRLQHSPSTRIGGAYVHHSDHPFRRSGWALRVGADVPLARRAFVSGTFRISQLTNADTLITTPSTNPGGGPGPGGPGGPASTTRVSGIYEQPEVHLAAGLRERAWGLAAHFAYVNDRGEFDDDLFAVGLSGRLSHVGDLWLEGSASFYPDATVLRLSPWWRIELGRGFYVRPGGAVERADGDEWLGSYFAELGLAGSRGAVFAGGRGGRERRPTYLLVPLMLNLADDLTWGVWAGSTLRIGDRVEFRAVYQLDSLELIYNDTRQQGRMHTLTLSLGIWI